MNQKIFTKMDEKSIYFNSLYENLICTPPRVICSNKKIIYSAEDIAEYNFFDYYRDQCKKTAYDNLETPHIIYTGIGTIVNLLDLEYSNEIVKYLNKKGLIVFLWEIIGLTTKKNNFLDVTTCNDPEKLKDFYVSHDKKIYSYELDSLEKFVVNNNLKKVTVVTFEYETKKLLQEKYNKFKILSSNNMFTCYRPIFEKNRICIEPKDITHKFLSMSKRYETHRHIVSSYLIDKNAFVSWKEQYRDLCIKPNNFLNYTDQECSFDFASWATKFPSKFKKIKQGMKFLEENFPISLPSEKNIDYKICGSFYSIPHYEFCHSFCNIIGETTFEKCLPTFSEKVLISMLCNRPFILASTANSLCFLKKLGFKTFDQWWDESYDQEQNHEKRLIKILEIIDYIDSLTISEIREVYVQMKSVFLHNQRTLQKMSSDFYFLE